MNDPSGHVRKAIAPAKLAIGIVVVVAVILLAMLFAPDREVYAQWESPDGNHIVSVFRFQRFFAMPGQGSDAPGLVLLTDRDGIVLNRRRIEMVQLASEPVWGDGRVRMKLLFDWELK